MLTYLYKFKYYRAIKSGFLLDYFIKKFILITWTKWIIQFNCFFNDKYLIEQISKNYYITYLNIFYTLQNLQQLNAIYLVNIVVVTLLTIQIVCLLWLW